MIQHYLEVADKITYRLRLWLNLLNLILYLLVNIMDCLLIQGLGDCKSGDCVAVQVASGRVSQLDGRGDHVMSEQRRMSEL